MRSKGKVLNMVALIAVLSMIATTVSARTSVAPVQELAPVEAVVNVTDIRMSAPEPEPPEPDVPPSKYELVAVEDSMVIDMGERAIYMIQLEDAPLASYRGGVAGLEATNPDVRGEVKLDVSSTASVAYLGYLEGKQAQFVASMEQAAGRTVEVVYQYEYAYNGMAARLTPQEAADIAKLPGVVHVERDYMLYPTTDVGPAWIGAPGIWDGSDTGGLPGTKGEGIVVGIIDGGINMDHPSFAATGDDAYTHTNPLGAGNYVGLCDTQAATYTCNSKLIGVWDFIPADGIDDDHGSHTASTTAGNVVYSPTINAPTITVTATKISGVAPHANIIAYDVCEAGGCPNSATTAAKDQAVADGVDVVNYSIGGGGANPWTDSGAQGWLNVRDAGIFAATSAGNAGPDAETMGSPGNSPWILTVGATTHNRKFRNALINMQGGTSPPSDIEGKSITSGYGPAPIVYAGDHGDALCLDPFPASTWTNGEIVVCDRGVADRAEKGENVLAGGAGGYVLANDVDNAKSLNADAHVLPAVHIAYQDGVTLKAWLTSTVVQTATIAGTTVIVNDAYADITAGFSSRGPNPDATGAASVIKPDITAPGVDVFAASEDGVEYESMGGTSMSSPHAAGAAALIRALHPSWTPAEVQSALMMAAWNTDVLKEDETTAADAFDMGAGRVDLSKAGMVGLVLNETTTNFEDADPDAGGDPTTLNLASLSNNLCLQQCTWDRTFENVLEVPTTYTATVVTATTGMTVTIDPITFTIPALGTQVVTVEADVSAMPTGTWVFAEVGLETDAAHPEYTVEFEEGFEGAYPPTGWYTYTTGVADDPGWIQTAAAAHSGSYAAGHFDDNLSGLGVSWLVTPQFTATIQTELAFWELTYWDAYYDYHGVWVSTGSGDPSSGVFTEVVELDTGTGGSWEKMFVDLSAYAGTPIYIAFRYTGDYSDWWLVDDVAVRDVADSAYAISDLHMPLAVRPSTGVLPNLVEVNTRRNAGSQLIEDLQALEITDLTIDYYGFTEATLTTESLLEDSANGSPYDSLTDGVFYITATIPAGANRLVAEVTSSEAPDIDLFVGQDLDGDGPEESEEVCTSTTPSWNEYCNVSGSDLVAGTWWILVQNWQGSASQPDEVVLSTAVVPGTSSGNMTVTGPTTVTQKTEFDLRLFWDIPTMEAGDRWYGALAIGTDPSHHGNVGTIPVNLTRYPDDVSKEVSGPRWTGSVVTYTISVQPNVTDEGLTYFITDTIPAGLTYVPGSAYAPKGTVNVVGDQITWSGMMPAGREYVVSTSLDDPNCGNLMDGTPTYYDWFDNYGWTTDSGISGDGIAWGYSGAAFTNMSFYGEVKSAGVRFTDDGYAKFLGTANYSSTHQNIPDPTIPNDLMAPLWFDFEIVYDAVENRGITTGSGGTFFMVEYDDVEPAPAGSTDFRLDFEMMMDGAVNDAPGAYEVVFAYDNISGTLDTGTIGVENADGTEAVNVGYNNISTIIADDLVICFDWAIAPEPVEITFQAVISEGLSVGDIITNTVLHNTDNPGSVEASASVAFTVQGPGPTWVKRVEVDGELVDTFPATVFGDVVEVADEVWISYNRNITFTLVEEWSESLELEDYEVDILLGGLTMMPTQPGMSVVHDTGVLTWTVTNLPCDWGYIITKTFHMTGTEGVSDYITETLEVEGAYPQPDVVYLVFQHPQKVFLPLVMRDY